MWTSVRSIGVSVVSADQMNTVDGGDHRACSPAPRADGTATSDFTIANQDQLLATVGSVSTLLSVLLAGIASISLIVGGIGIMNIMLVSVRERTREIGIRKAIGARGRDILAQFLIEALALSLAGGLVGIVIGLAISLVIGVIAGWGFIFSPLTIVAAVGFQPDRRDRVRCLACEPGCPARPRCRPSVRMTVALATHERNAP